VNKKCKNCEHFRQKGVLVVGDVWGEYLKTGKNCPDTKDQKAQDVFAWADEGCSDFEPRKTPIGQSERQS
jgi:hypothetical protein